MDPIQNSSSVPLPHFQTTTGGHDPLPLGGPEQTAQDATQAAVVAQQGSTADFEAYLNHSTITRLAAEQSSARFDAAHAVNRSSVYKDPGQSTPI